MYNVTIVGICRNQQELSILNLYQQLYPGNRYAYVTATQSIDDVRELKLQFPTQTPDIDDKLWQIIHATVTQYTVVVDCKMFGLLNLSTLISKLDTYHLILGTPTYHSEPHVRSRLLHVGDYFIAFDKHSTNYQFFDNLRDIGRNWGKVSVQACTENLRDKRLEVELAIAYQLIDVDRRSCVCIEPFVSNDITVLNGVILHQGQQLYPLTTHHVLEN